MKTFRNIFLTVSCFLALNLCVNSCNDTYPDFESFFKSETWTSATKYNLGEKGYTPDLQVLKYPLASLQYNKGGIADSTQWWVRWEQVDSNSFQHLREGIPVGYRRLWSYACAIYDGAEIPKGRDSSDFDFVVNVRDASGLDDWGYYFNDMLWIELGNSVYQKVYFYFQDETCTPIGWMREPKYGLPLMGVHAGCAVLYYQDVDITGLSGVQTLEVEVNPLRRVREQDYKNNVVTMTVSIDNAGVHFIN